MDKKSIFLVILSAILSGIVTVLLGVMITLFMTPQFAIEYDDWNRTGCRNLENWGHNATCPDEDGHIVIDIEKIKLENTGVVQAKNVILVLNSYGEGNLRNIECPEGIIQPTETSNIKKIEFPRFSKNLSCQFDFETLAGSRIDTVTVTADDTPGYQWTSAELHEQKIGSFILFAILFISLLIFALGIVFYAGYQTVRDILLQKRLSIPVKIKSYSCDLRFEVPITNDANNSENESINAREEWIKKVQSLSETFPNRKPIDDNYDEIIFKIKNDDVKINIPKKTTIQNRGTEFVAANLNVTTKKIITLQKLLDMGKHPCWTFFSYLPNEFNVENFVDKVKIKSGTMPGSSASISKNNSPNVLTDATYHLLDVDTGTIRTTFSKGTSEQGGKIGIIHDGQANIGFHRIRSVLSPRKIILMTFGEISIARSVKIINKSCTPKGSWYQR